MTRASGQADYVRCCCRSSIQEPGTVLEGADQGISDKGGVSVKISGRSVSTRLDPELRAHQGRSAALVISRRKPGCEAISGIAASGDCRVPGQLSTLTIAEGEVRSRAGQVTNIILKRFSYAVSDFKIYEHYLIIH